MPSKQSPSTSELRYFLGKALVADQVAEGRHYVVEGQLVVVHRTGLDVSGPPHDERNADAALVALALEPAQLAVTPEELGIGTALLMRPLSLLKITIVFSSSPSP